MEHRSHEDIDELAIAIIGMAGRFPGADSIEEFWQNLQAGSESITHFTAEELREAGVPPNRIQQPTYVRANPCVSDTSLFDADFFGMSPREAQFTDPQHRVFLECAWEALEHAGYSPSAYEGAIGVYAGAGINRYLIHNLAAHVDASDAASFFSVLIGNDKDFLPSRVAYKLNLTGPAVNVQTACSTSLVAVHLACRSLIEGECDMTLAGGITLRVPQKTGYLYQEGMILSPDGHCRAFDVQAQGTLGGEGAGIVVLKRLQDALADGDCIHAVIRGSAMNNDGANKVGYTAPSVAGQAAVIADAQALAGISPETITYIEAHGTGTPLGDPIEVAALTQAFRQHTQKKEFCAIGSLKTNIGHTDTAAGVLGLIKTVLALKHGQIPPSLHFEQPNPAIDFAESPFYVNTQLAEWERNGTPRRAGVSAFGIGGTNAHIIVEEAPAVERMPNEGGPERPVHLLTLSAKSEAALQRYARRYQDFLAAHPESDLGDLCYTSHTGRTHFAHRLAIAADSPTEMQAQLAAYSDGAISTGFSHGAAAAPQATPKIAFLFTGQGAQYLGMGRELYETQPLFRQRLEQCDAVLRDCLGRSLLELLYPAAPPEHNDLMESQPCGQAAIFAVECALADLWRSWGIEPDVVLGHSLGDFAAAYTAGVLSLEDGLRLVVERGRLMDSAAGSMVSVLASEVEVIPFIAERDDVTVGVINGSRGVVLSGSYDGVAGVESALREAGFKTRRLDIPVAAHSPMLDPVLDAFEAAVRAVPLSSPTVSVVSGMTGQPVGDKLTDPGYWRQHLRNTVHFADGIQTLHRQGVSIFLEIGPQSTLLGLVEPPLSTDQPLPLPSYLPSLRKDYSGWQQMLTSLGELYVRGVQVDWLRFDRDYPRRKVTLPTYPFQRQRYWIEPGPRLQQNGNGIFADHHDNAANGQPQGSVQPAPVRETFSPEKLEQTITALWQQILGRHELGAHDDFFEMGGSSLLAVQVTSKLQEALHISVPPSIILSAPTAAQLAASILELIDSDQAPDPICLVKFQSGQPANKPLFFVHPSGGSAYWYRTLATYLGADQPVYGIQDPSLETDMEPFVSVAEMAAHYVDAIRSVQPSGPYLLGGSSFGGTVAFEMAQQLRKQGKEVALLTLVDTPGPRHSVAIATDETLLLSFLQQSWQNEPGSTVEVSGKAPEEQVLHFLRHADRTADSGTNGLADEGMERYERLLELYKLHVLAMRNYAPVEYSGRVLYILPEEKDADMVNHAFEEEWRAFCTDGMTIESVPGNHITMNLPPHVQVLAQKLRTHLERVQSHIREHESFVQPLG